MLEEAIAAQGQKTQKAVDELFKLQQKEFEFRQQIAIKTRELECSHVAGGNPLSECRDLYSRTCIVWHTLNESAGSVVVGVCTNCQRQFLPENLDYTYWRSRPSINRPSSAGRELPIEEGEEVPDYPNIPIEKNGLRLTEEDLLRERDFESLNDFELRELMGYVREKRRKAKEQVPAESKMQVRRAMTQSLPQLAQFLASPSVSEQLASGGKKIDAQELDRLWLEVGELKEAEEAQ